MASRIKYDGYRNRLERDCDRVSPYDWTDRFREWPSSPRVRQKRFAIDGAAVIRL
jgi:hypothetical protein